MNQYPWAQQGVFPTPPMYRHSPRRRTRSLRPMHADEELEGRVPVRASSTPGAPPGVEPQWSGAVPTNGAFGPAQVPYAPHPPFSDDEDEEEQQEEQQEALAASAGFVRGRGRGGANTFRVTPVMHIPQTLIMRESMPSCRVYNDELATFFRVYDNYDRRRYRVVTPHNPLAAKFDARVFISKSSALWTVVPSGDARVKYLRLANSYQFFLSQRAWLPRVERVVQGFKCVNGKPTMEQAIAVKSDEVGKRFEVRKVERGKEVSLLASASRVTEIFKDVNESVHETSTWTVRCEPNVDSALMAALISVLELWTMEEQAGRRHGDPVQSSADSSQRFIPTRRVSDFSEQFG